MSSVVGLPAVAAPDVHEYLNMKEKAVAKAACPEPPTVRSRPCPSSAPLPEISGMFSLNLPFLILYLAGQTEHH